MDLKSQGITLILLQILTINFLYKTFILSVFTSNTAPIWLASVEAGYNYLLSRYSFINKDKTVALEVSYGGYLVWSVNWI